MVRAEFVCVFLCHKPEIIILLLNNAPDEKWCLWPGDRD